MQATTERCFETTEVERNVERLTEIINEHMNDGYDEYENGMTRFANAYHLACFSDDERPCKIFRRIFNQYINGSDEVRYIINDVLTMLCGYGISTLLDMSNNAKTEDWEQGQRNLR